MFPRFFSSALLLTTALVSPAALAAEAKYPATVDVFAGGGNEGFEGGLELIAPFVEGAGSLLFGLARGVVGDESGAGGVGLGYRSQFLPGWILGGYGMLDYQRGRSHEGYFQGVLGLEALTESFDFRLNGYLPENDETTLADIGGSAPPPPPVTAGDIAIVGHEIGLVTGVTAGTPGLFRAFERPLPGIDAEIGYRLPLPGHDFRIFLGAFHFDDGDYESITGPKARAEWRIHDLDLFGNNSRLTIEAGIRDDDVRGTDASAGVRIRIPFGGVPSNQRGHELAGLDQRMLDPIRRETHIVTGEREESQAGTTGTVEIEAVQAVETGTEIASIWFADGAGGGDGTQGNETTLGAAVAGAGAGGLVVALGGSGDLAGNVTLANDQILLGGASTLQIQGLTTSTMATYAPGGARPTILDDGTAATAVVQLADGNLLAGFDTTSDGVNILGNGVDDLIVRQVGTGGLGSGMAVIGGTNIEVTDFAYRRSAPTFGGFGFELLNVTGGNLDGLQIENAGTGLLVQGSQTIDVADLMSLNSANGFIIRSSNDVELSGADIDYTLPIAPTASVTGGFIGESTNVQVDGATISGVKTGFQVTRSTDVDAGNVMVAGALVLGAQIDHSTNVVLHDFSIADGPGGGLNIIDSTSTARVVTVRDGIISNVGSNSAGAVTIGNVTGDVSGGNTGITLSNIDVLGAQGLSTAVATGIFVSGAHGINLMNIEIDGRNGMGVAVTGNALEIGGSTNVTASGVQVANILGNGMRSQNSSSVGVSNFSIANSAGTGIIVIGGTGNSFSQGSISDAVASATTAGAGGIFVRAQNTTPTQAAFSDIAIKGASSTIPGLATGVGVFNSIPGASINASFNNIGVDASATGGATVTFTGFRAEATTGTVTVSGTGNTSDAATDCSITSAGGSIEIDGVVHSDASC